MNEPTSQTLTRISVKCVLWSSYVCRLVNPYINYQNSCTVSALSAWECAKPTAERCIQKLTVMKTAHKYYWRGAVFETTTLEFAPPKTEIASYVYLNIQCTFLFYSLSIQFKAAPSERETYIEYFSCNTMRCRKVICVYILLHIIYSFNWLHCAGPSLNTWKLLSWSSY